MKSTIGRILAAAVMCACGTLQVESASAALRKYIVRRDNITFTTQTSPTSTRIPSNEEFSKGAALVDEANPVAVLTKLDIGTDVTVTVQVPGLSGFVFVSRKFTDNPEPGQTAAGVGNTGGQIYWGTLTGWQSSGHHWCNSEPSTLCVLLGIPDEDTGRTPIPSPFYNIGTWFFHGTGFTSAPPWVYTRFTAGGPGSNQQYVLRGAFAPDGTVPALPVLGLGLLGASVATAGLAAMRRRRR